MQSAGLRALFFVLAGISVPAQALLCPEECALRISTLEAKVQELQIRLTQVDAAETGRDDRRTKGLKQGSKVSSSAAYVSGVLRHACAHHPLRLLLAGRTKVSAGCYTIKNKSECCSSYDGRADYASVSAPLYCAKPRTFA